MLKNTFLFLISTLISLIILEVVIRIVLPQTIAYVPTLLNNELTYVPDQHERSRHLEWDYEVHINSDGFRNDKLLANVPAGTLLALGDSFTEGYGVSLAASYPKRLEEIFALEKPGFHVYNAGHYDTALPTYRRVYREIFKHKAEVTHVIIGLFVGNDVLLSANTPDGRLQTGNEFGDGWKYKFKVFLASSVATYSALNYVIKTNPVLFDICKSLGACYRPRPPNIYSRELIDKAVLHTTNFVESFVAEIRSDNRKVAVVLIPTREQVDDEIWGQAVVDFGHSAEQYRFAMNTEIANSLRAAGIDMLDLTSIARDYERESGDRLYYKFDGHWNSLGHQVAADHIAKFYQQLTSH